MRQQEVDYHDLRVAIDTVVDYLIDPSKFDGLILEKYIGEHMSKDDPFSQDARLRLVAGLEAEYEAFTSKQHE